MEKETKIVYYVFENYHEEIHKRINYINSGGCGIFAVLLYKALVNLGLSPKLMVLTNEAEEMKKRIRNENHDYWGSLVVHTYVYIFGKYMDSEGLFDDPYKNFGDYRQITEIPVEVMEEWNNNEEIWNDKFNRKHIPVIKKKFDEINEKVLEKFG